MKNLYKKNKLTMLLKEYPLIYVFCPKDNESKFLFENNIKSIKIKNTLLKSYNKNLFNGDVLLIYGENVQQYLKELKNIVGIFCINNNKNYFITFGKFLKILIYLKKNLKYNSIFNVLKGPLFWFLLKI